MEDYLQYMRTLRTQMNDVEDQAAKTSVEEQMQITTIHTLERDLNSAISGIKQLIDDTDQMLKTRGHMCSKILENQKRVATLESDAFTLSQTLELIQQERSNLCAKANEKSKYYAKVAEDMNSKLLEQRDWLETKRQNEVAKASNMQTGLTEDISSEVQCVACNMGEVDEELLQRKLQSVQVKLREIIHEKIDLVTENSKMKQTLDQLNNGIEDLETELSAMDVITLEEQHKAILSEKSGETEYVLSLQSQVVQLEGISHVVRCACGGEYKVDLQVCVV